MRRERIAEAIRNAVEDLGYDLREPLARANVTAAIMEIVGPVSSEPTGVSLLDGGDYRSETTWTVLDRGRPRVVRFTVARGHFVDDGPRAA